MGVSLKVKGSFSILNKNLKNIESNFRTGKELERIAILLNSSILTKVNRSGIGVSGKRMIPYTPKYASFKRNKGFESTFRNLNLTGQMWASLTTSRGRNKARMFFGNADGRQKSIHNQRVDKFFGISSKERAIIISELNKLVKNL